MENQSLDGDQLRFVETFHTFLEDVVNTAQARAQQNGPSIGTVVGEHLGTDPRQLPVVREEVPEHQFVDLDVALSALVERAGGERVVGVGGGDQRQHQGFGEMLADRWGV